MDANYSQQHGDYSPCLHDFINRVCDKYQKLKKKQRRHRPSSRICLLAIPKRCFCPSRPVCNKFKPNVHIVRLDGRQRTRLEQLAYPSVRRLLETRNRYRYIYHPRRYLHMNKIIRKSLFSLYSRLANVQAPKEPIRPKPWTKSEWKKHKKILKLLSYPKQIPQPPKVVRPRIPLEELLPRLKKISKPKKIPQPLPLPPPKTLKDMNRTLELAKPKPYDPSLYVKPPPTPVDPNYKPSKRILRLAVPKDVSASESDTKENPYQVSPNALKYKCKEGSRLANMAKPKEYEEPPINQNAFTVSKNALKAKASKRIIELAQPKGGK